MKTRTEKYLYLISFLEKENNDYYDFFKEDILLFLENRIDDEQLCDENINLTFLDLCQNYKDIENWVNLVCHYLVMKYNEEDNDIEDIIDNFCSLTTFPLMLDY